MPLEFEAYQTELTKDPCLPWIDIITHEADKYSVFKDFKMFSVKLSLKVHS